MEQDPVKFNYLLYLWDQIQSMILKDSKNLPEQALYDQIESDLSDLVRSKNTIDDLKRKCGIDV